MPLSLFVLGKPNISNCGMEVEKLGQKITEFIQRYFVLKYFIIRSL